MQTEHTEAAFRATAQHITADDALAESQGIDSIPTDEVIVEPNPAHYRAHPDLLKTAPDLKPNLDQLLSRLCELNSRFVGTQTLRAQVQLSFSGDHEELEEDFLSWCRVYFERRGSVNNLNPGIGNDPWRLYQKCYDEFRRFLEYRIGQVGTLNSTVLNLSQRYMLSAFAHYVLRLELTKYGQKNQSQFGSIHNVARAMNLLEPYMKQITQFRAMMDQIAANLPAAYAPVRGTEWKDRIRTQVAQRAEDLNTFRHIMTVLVLDGPRRQQLTPDLWASLHYDVYHGRSVATVRTSESADVTIVNSTCQLLSFRRDGWLCNREYSWIRVDPDSDDESRLPELAVDYYVLDTLTRPLYEAWLTCDVPHLIDRGTAPDATEDEQNAALAAVVASSTETDDEGGQESTAVNDSEVERNPRRSYTLGVYRVREFVRLLCKHFCCKWSPAKGSEIKVVREGGRYCNIRRHGTGDTIWSGKIRDCLDMLNISVGDFIDAWRGQRG